MEKSYFFLPVRHSGYFRDHGRLFTGPPHATVLWEASTAHGAADEWAVTGQAILSPTGHGAFSAVADPGSIGRPTNFYRLK